MDGCPDECPDECIHGLIDICMATSGAGGAVCDPTKGVEEMRFQVITRLKILNLFVISILNLFVI